MYYANLSQVFFRLYELEVFLIDNKSFKAKINANGTEIAVLSSGNQNDYISLTDIAKYKSDEPSAVIQNWIRNRDTIEFLGLWEQLYNPNFKPLEFEGFKNEAGSNTFVLSPQKWIAKTNAIGIISKSGRSGGTFAHKDIPGYLQNSSCT